MQIRFFSFMIISSTLKFEYLGKIYNIAFNFKHNSWIICTFCRDTFVVIKSFNWFWLIFLQSITFTFCPCEPYLVLGRLLDQIPHFIWNPIKVGLKLYYLILLNCIFLLSEHILCKESIAIVKKFDFKILTYLNVLRSPEFIYAIFAMMCVCTCVCLCVWEWTQ